MEGELKNRKNKNSQRNNAKRKNNKGQYDTEENDSEVRLLDEFKLNGSRNVCTVIDKENTICEREGDGESTSEQIAIDKNKMNTLVQNKLQKKPLKISIEIDVISALLFAVAVITRFYRLEEPRNIVFDELHYGKYVSLYMKRTFFFDAHPPLGKQLIAAAAYLAGFDGNFKFDAIGSPYKENVPLFALRFVPAMCGSLLVPATYHFMLELGCKQWTAALAAFLILCDNAILTQSRFILMESMLLLFTVYGMFCVLRFRKLQDHIYCWQWWFWLSLASLLLTLAVCVKYVGFFSCCLGMALVWWDYWRLLSNKLFSDFSLFCNAVARFLVMALVGITVYLTVFYIHLAVLSKAGPHDSIMTSAFQASLEGGLASITRGQPLLVSHGSHITLRHTFGRACWLHSHNHVYPILYADKRGSSHQQQVTCYCFKDVNNWWIVRIPTKKNLIVTQPVEPIRHGDIIQLIHGITIRALNSHDVAAPMSPQNQEVSCYIDYNVSMPAQNLWRVDIVNKDEVGEEWHAIESQVRLIHVSSNQALKYSGRQLPDWGFNQHEVVTDKIINQADTVWNVEEHRYTKSEDEKERERDLLNAEMIPLSATKLSFWSKFLELQYKMLFVHKENVQNHMYSSEPLDWPMLTRGIAYWVSSEDNGQIHLLGNVIIWYSGATTLALYCTVFVFYLLRRRRNCYDLHLESWNRFVKVGEVLFLGYLFHFVPFFFVEQTLFLHHYLPAFTFKALLTAAFIEHIHDIVKLNPQLNIEKTQLL
ncbi:protein O-mannosyltransferase rt isoform X2 [Lycorma delicatula]|uniref:protein O-mannosyltransferase rt isoform X2 n=1 Tax=Lycorma delicatula TaxID=130591 RepID=UPI003F50F39A